MDRTGYAAPALPRESRVAITARRLRRAWTRQTVSGPTLGRLLGLFVLVVVAASAAGLGHGPAAQTFLLVFTSIVIEALPFILLGALASAAIAVYLPERAFGSIARLPARPPDPDGRARRRRLPRAVSAAPSPWPDG